MEEKIFKSYKEYSRDVLELINEALRNPDSVLLNLSDLGNEIKYEEKYDFTFKPNVHMEQRKMLITELRFLNKYVKFANSLFPRKYFILYVSDAPSYHLYELLKYYPFLTFIRIGKNISDVYVSDDISIISREYTYTRITNFQYDKDVRDLYEIKNLSKFLVGSYKIINIKQECTAELLANIKNELPEGSVVYLWSYFNTPSLDSYNNENIIQKELRKENYQDLLVDYDLLKNLNKQYSWIKDSLFEISMLTFKLPYDDNPKTILKKLQADKSFEDHPELDLVGMYKTGKLKYPSGKIYVQPWTPKSSTEARLVVKSANMDILNIYNISEYNAYFNYYNSIDRFMRKRDNNKKFYEYGYCECNDCAIELHVFKEYLAHNTLYLQEAFKISKKIKLKDIIGILSLRIECLFGCKLEIPEVHGINRY